jgi:hypothetical protein
MEFYIGQIFEGAYPPEAALWCNSNNAHIEDTGRTKEITVEEEYTVIVEEEREFIFEEEQINESGETVFVPVTKTEIVPVEKTETRTVQRTLRIYEIAENPPPPETKTVRTFSKFSIWVATHEMPLELEDGTQTTVWAAFEAFLNNAGLWTGWLQLVDLVEDNPFFEAFYPQAVEAFGKELVDGVLAASVTSTKEIIIEQ